MLNQTPPRRSALGARIQNVLCICAFSLLAVACGGSLKVVKQASPNVFSGEKNFVLEPISFKGVKADKEHQGIIAKAYDSEVRDEGSQFQFKKKGSDDTTVLRTKVTRLEEGSMVSLTPNRSELDIQVQLMRGGKVLDEIIFTASTGQNEGASVGGVSLSGNTDDSRLETTAEKLAGDVVGYLKDRTK